MQSIYLKYRHLYGTSRWQQVRRMCFERDGFRCRSCGLAGKLEADHILPMHTLIKTIMHAGPDDMDQWQAEGLFFDLRRVQTLCRSCHLIKTQREAGRERKPEGKCWQALAKEMV